MIDQYAYKRGETNIQTLLRNGKCIYSGKPAQHYIDAGFEIMNPDEAVHLVDKALEERYSGQWEEISEKEFWDMLEVLPPESYHYGCFRMSEYTESNYTSHFIHNHGKYYTATRKAINGWTPYFAELATQLENASA